MSKNIFSRDFSIIFLGSTKLLDQAPLSIKVVLHSILLFLGETAIQFTIGLRATRLLLVLSEP